MKKNMVRKISLKTFIPITLLAVFITSYIFYRIRIIPQISGELAHNLRKYIGTVFIFCLFFVVHKIIEAILMWYKENITSKTITQLDDKLIPIVLRTAKVIIWTIAILLALPLYGVNISVLVTTLGVSSLAIALAAQDTIANIIAGFLLMIDTPFNIGDKIRLPSGERVSVIDIGVRRSKFLSEDNAVIIVPNVDLSRSKIVNYTYGEKVK